MRAGNAAVTLAALLALAAAPPQREPSDPDSPAVRAAAREAMARANVLAVSGQVPDVVGLTRGVEGLLRELGAKVTTQEIRIQLQAEVLFDFDKSDLKPQAEATLRKVGEVIRANPGAVIVEGHTDSKGDDAYNQKLSLSRAASVKDWLVKNGGAEAARISTRGFGETRPIAPNTKPGGGDDPEGRQQNRRVEIAIRR